MAPLNTKWSIGVILLTCSVLYYVNLNYRFTDPTPQHNIPSHLIHQPKIQHKEAHANHDALKPKRNYTDECLSFIGKWTLGGLVILGTYTESDTIGILAQYHPPLDRPNKSFQFDRFGIAPHGNMSHLVGCDVSKSSYPRSTGFFDIQCRVNMYTYFQYTDRIDFTLLMDTPEFGREVIPSLPACTLKSSQTKHYFTVSTQFKDRKPFIKEWIEYYRLIGATHFYLYDHGSSDNPLSILKEYIDQNIVTYVPWNAPVIQNTPFSTVQPPTFTHSLANFRKFSQWIAFFDIDEFIIPVGKSFQENRTIIPILNRYDRDDVAAIKLADVDFLGPKTLNIPEFVIEHYTLRSPGASFKKGKTIAKAPFVKRMAIHDIGRSFYSQAKTHHADFNNEMRMNHYRCAHRRQAHRQCNNMSSNFEDRSIYPYLLELKSSLKQR